MQFNTVWYREGAQISPWSIPYYQDAGSLVVADDSIKYIGKKWRLSIPFSTIERVVFGRQGIDWVNTWVTIECSSGYRALFRDGGSLGWAGLLGGTRRIYNEIGRAVGQGGVSIEMQQANRISRAGYALLFLAVIVWTPLFRLGCERIYWGLSGLLKR